MGTIIKFWDKVNKEDMLGCWTWKGSTTGNVGYGEFNFEGKRQYAHRVAYKIAKGPLLDTERVMHSCDNRKCVNPAHLTKGTQLENMQDKVKKGRHHNNMKTHCPQGHEYTPENTTYQKPTLTKGELWRVCIQCRKERHVTHKM